MIVKMFCQTNSTQANGAPGATVHSLRFQLIPGTPAPSAGHFQNGNGNAVLELHNVTQAVAVQFTAGQCYDLEIVPAAQ